MSKPVKYKIIRTEWGGLKLRAGRSNIFETENSINGWFHMEVWAEKNAPNALDLITKEKGL